MPSGTQSKILRVLVDQQFTRVGGTEKVRVDLRVVSSTSRDLDAEIAAGRLVEVLQDFAARPNGIYAVFPQRKHLALRVRLWIDFLKHHYAQSDFWEGQDAVKTGRAATKPPSPTS